MISIIIIIINVLRTQNEKYTYSISILFVGSRCFKKRDVSNKDNYTIAVQTVRCIILLLGVPHKRAVCGKVEYWRASSVSPGGLASRTISAKLALSQNRAARIPFIPRARTYARVAVVKCGIGVLIIMIM